MLMFLQIGALILVGVIIAEFTIWSWQNRNIWWLVPIPAIIAYLSLLSRFLFKDEDLWVYKVSEFLWNIFLARLTVVALTFGILLSAPTPPPSKSAISSPPSNCFSGA